MSKMTWWVLCGVQLILLLFLAAVCLRAGSPSYGAIGVLLNIVVASSFGFAVLLVLGWLGASIRRGVIKHRAARARALAKQQDSDRRLARKIRRKRQRWERRAERPD